MTQTQAYRLGPIFYRSQAFLVLALATAVATSSYLKFGSGLFSMLSFLLPALFAWAVLIWIATVVKNRKPNLTSWTAIAIAIPGGPVVHSLIGLSLYTVLWAASQANVPLTETEIKNLRFGLTELAIFGPLLWASVKIHRGLKRL